MLWVLFSLLAAFCWAIVNTVDKYVITRWVRTPFVPMSIMGFVAFSAAMLILIFRGFSEMAYLHIFLAGLTGVSYVLTTFLYFRAIKVDEVSRIIPLYQLAPLFVLIFATIFLGEVFTAITYVGIFLVVSGSFLITYRVSEGIRIGRGIRFMVASVLLMSMSSVLTKYLLGFTDYWTVFSYSTLGTFVALIPFALLHLKDIRTTARRHGAKSLGVIAVRDVINYLGVLCMFVAVSAGFVTLARTLTSLQPFFVLLFAVFLSMFFPKIMKEDIDRKTITLKVVAILLLVVGAVIII